jgi:tetratricopeptide (TPR) repeat protein
MHSYGVSDVERLLRLSRGTIRRLVARGFVSPARGPRREYRFSFQDLIILRTARALALANVPARRIGRSLNELRRRLPKSVPLSGLSICAVGDQVVVRKGESRWQAESGQYLLELDVSITDGSLHIVEVERLREDRGAEAWFEEGLSIEETDSAQALRAYEQCRALDASHVGARINLGRLLQEAGRFEEAEHVYREALRHCEPDATVHFNLGVLLEDTSRYEEAIDAYLAAVTEDPDFADAHFNLARLYELLSKPQHAIRHLGCYRRLVRTETGI